MHAHSPPHLRGPRSLAGQLFAMQVVLVALVAMGCAVFAYVSAGLQVEEIWPCAPRSSACTIAAR